MFKGLSTEQAPPITVPFRFFLTAPIFAMIIGVLFFIYPMDIIFNRYSNVAIAITHLFTLGVISMMMFGALQQMLPVLAGVVIKKPILFANIVHITLTLGTLSLSSGFLFSINILLILGAIFLSISFGTFLFIVTRLLFKVKYLTTTVNAMKIFSMVSIITVLLGLHLVTSYITSNISNSHYDFVNIHIAFGIFGFAFILVMGVAFQVIPMFYVARDFPKNIQNKFPRVVFGMLGLFALFTILKLETNSIKNILSLLAIIFSYYAIVSLNNRKRPVFDITLWYWKLSMGSLIVSMTMFILDMDIYLISAVFAFGFIYSILQGMVYKIIPFLSWFHLSSRGHFDIPTLREFIFEFDIKIQFYIYVSSIFCFILATQFNQIFLYIGGGLFIVSNLLLILNMIKAIKTYNRLSKLDPMAAYK
ncbi:MAG: hypothetical protein U9R16_04980 [Campylobacterota bacterium]|nr:hypothetical protein [Campylobacterota bacterium]